VRRGTIIEAIKVLGRVQASQEADLYFKSSGRLRSVNVESGQFVKAGDVLAELETGQLLTNLAKARVSYENAQVRLQQAQSKAVVDDSALDREAVEQARISLQQAQLALEKLKAGPTEADLRAAEAGVISARAAYQRAQADLAAKRAELAAKQADLEFRLRGPTPLDLANAQAALESARIKLAQARAGPRPEDIQAARLQLDQARTRLAQLLDAPKVRPEDIANAELEVEKARVALDKAAAEAASSKTLTPAQAEATVRSAQLALETAQNNLNKLKSSGQPTPWDIRQQELAIQAAEANLNKLLNPSPYDVQLAQIAVDQAQAKLDALLAGPTEQELTSLRAQITSLEQAVQSAEAALPSSEAAVAAAEARLELLKQGPTELDIKEAENKVAIAQNQLEQAEARLLLKGQSLAQQQVQLGYDIDAAQKAVESARLDLEWLESQNIDSKIIAPFDGKVTRVNGKPGDNISAYNIVISLSSPEDLIIKADIAEADLPKLAVGQKADITLDVYPGMVLEGTVYELPTSIVTQTGVVTDRSTKIRVTWPKPGAELGMISRVQIVVQRKDDVLIVPSSAVRTVGRRRFVEYMDGNIKRSRNVEVGISSDTETEIVSGVEEGMVILSGQ